MYPQTLSRPYANAAFSLATANKSEGEWSAFLQHGKSLLQMNMAGGLSLAGFLRDPRLSADTKVKTLVDIFDKIGNVWGSVDNKTLQMKFLSVLAETGRLTLLPAIADHFEASWAKARGLYPVLIDTAFPMSSEVEKALCVKLETLFKVKLTPKVQTNASLLGGFRATVGNRVLDCSLQSLLDKAKISLSH